jgi:hypothetical protein
MQAQQLLNRLRMGGTRDRGAAEQPEFAGTWRTARNEDLEDFLERAMGVGHIKRRVANKATQTQQLKQEGGVVHLEISDQRGTAKYTIQPDGKARSSRGFQKLPIQQKARWSNGALVVEERYSQHLGGAEHGQKCSGASCPVVRSRRSVDRGTGNMVVELERTLLNGDTVRTRTFYAPVEKRKGKKQG